MIVLKGRVLDGNGGAPIEKGAVVLEDNRIRLVCRQSELPDDPTAEVYELEDGTIMPGLIDAHVHMGWGSATAVDWISMTPQLSMARALRDMAQLRQQGYTAFRDLGSDVLLMRPAVAEGLLDVPRIFGAGRIISQIGGHGDVYQKLSLEASQRAYSPAFIVNGVDEVRRACRINARNGADLIKIMTTGGVFSQGDKATPHSHFSQEEIRAAVEEAENMGSYVSTHAQATRGIKMALKNGVKCIEHGFYLDEECIELMVKNDCYLVPTLAIMHASKLYFQGKEGVLPYLKEKTENPTRPTTALWRWHERPTSPWASAATFWETLPSDARTARPRWSWSGCVWRGIRPWRSSPWPPRSTHGCYRWRISWERWKPASWRMCCW